MQVAVVATSHTDDAIETRVELEVAAERARLDVTLPPGPGRIDVVIELDDVDLAPWEPAGEQPGGPAVHELRAALATPDGHALDRRRTRFGLRTARIVTDDAGHAQIGR